MTIPGQGGQVPARPDQQTRPQPYVPVSPGGTPIARVTEIIITPGGVLEGIFTYSTNPGAAGTLIETASVAAAGTDQYGNHFVAGHASYAGNFATSLNAGFVQFYSGSLAAGWTAKGTITTNVLGDIALLAAVGRQVITNNNTLDDGSGNMSVVGLTVNGSSSTGAGDNGGVTSGPSGTVNAFPAAGPNHTHAEFHHHPL
jgi:TM2 domain-containing membrane protein YozV